MKNTNTVRTEIHYTQVGEYQLPLLTLPQTDDTEPLGKYGRMRLAHLKTQRPVLYNRMLLSGSLWPHLQEVQKTASGQQSARLRPWQTSSLRRTKNAHSSSGRPM